MGRALRTEKAVHGCPASGLAMAGSSSVGPCKSFSGDKKAAGSKGSGSDDWKAVGNVGQAKHKTAKAKAGVVGAGKASGSNY
jgi:hypothetical protein